MNPGKKPAMLAESCCRHYLPFWLRIIAVLVIAAASVRAQDSQFLFDPNGNLQAVTAGTTALPRILSQPQNQVVAPGDTASFSVLVANAAGLSYQWKFNGVDIGGATRDSLLIANVTSTNEGQYSVFLANTSGNAISAPAALMIDSDGDGMPDSWEMAHFGNLNQTATGDFDGDGASNLQEFFDGTDPGDNTSRRYHLIVFNDGGSVTINPSRLSFTNGETVTLTASPFAPYYFRGWTGDVNTTNNPLVLTMTNDMTVFAHQISYEITWTGGNGSWDVATNWSPAFVPGSNDNVHITRSVTVSVNGQAECAGLTLGDSASSPTLSGTGTLAVWKDSVWTSGSMGGGGRTVLAPGISLTINNSTTVTLNSRTVENGGTIIFLGSQPISFATSTLTNRSGALFDTRTSADFALSSGANRIDNAGVFRKSTDPGVTSINGGITFNNYGGVEIQTGTFTVAGGGLNNGAYDLAAGTTLILSGGVFTANPGSVISGPANFIVSGATATLSGGFGLTGTHTFTAGIANLNGDYSCTNSTMSISGGTANFNSTGIVAPTNLNLSNGILAGSGSVSVLNQLNWTGGSMNGSGRTVIVPGAVLNINNAGTVTLSGRTLENAGTGTWTGSQSIFLASAVLTNRPGALFEVHNAIPFALSSGVNRIDNAGTFRKSTSNGTTSINGGITFNNYSTVQVQTGTLALAGGGANNGTFEMGTNTTLNLSGGTFTANAGSSISGPAAFVVSGATATMGGLLALSGNHTFSAGIANLNGDYWCTNNAVTISGGTVNFNATGTVAPTNLNLSNGTLGGSGLVSVLNQLNWTGGSMNGNGRTLVAPGAVLAINNAGTVTLNTRTLENAGNATWTGSQSIFFASAVLTNRPGAIFDVQNAASFALSSGLNRVDNAGTFRKSANSGTTIIAANVALNNYGLVEIRGGILTVNGGFSSSSNAVLSCALNGPTAGTGYGQLQVSGSVTVNGALNLDLANGFVPTNNSSFRLLTATTRNGSFATFSYPSNQLTMQLSNAPNAVVALVTAVVPSAPVLLPPEIIGSDVKLTWSSTSNVTYRVEFTAALDSAPLNWTALSGDITATNTTATRLDPLTSTNRFYRIRMLP
jgi:hypothetical protein